MKVYRKSYKLKKKKPFFKNRFFLVLIIFLILTGGIFYLIFFLPSFQIKEIKISGNQKVPTQNLENFIKNKINRKFFIFSTQSIFLLNQKEIQKSILENFLPVSEVNFKRKFPASLSLEFKERIPAAIWCKEIIRENILDKEECFYVDREGVIFEEITRTADNIILPPIKDTQPMLRVVLGQKVLPEKALRFIEEIEKKLAENFQINVEEIIIPEENRLNIKTSEDWQIYFSLEKDLNWQIVEFNLLLGKEIPLKNRKNLEYIDLRFSKVYYKYR